MSEAHSIFSMSDEAFGWYLTGLTDGEGSFVLSKLQDKRNTRWKYVTGLFSICLRADDSPGLQALCERMGVGQFNLCSRNHRKPNEKPTAKWTVNKATDLATVIVPHFDKFPLTLKKARDFSVWREAILLLYKIKIRPSVSAGQRLGFKRKLTDGELESLNGFSKRLRQVREFDSSLMPQRIESPLIRNLFGNF